MDKSADAFRTISEVSEWLDTPAHVLRFWETRFAQIKPVKRAGGRRYYRPLDMLLLGGIKKLLHDDGITIKAAQKILRKNGVKHVQSLSQPVSVKLSIKKKDQSAPKGTSVGETIKARTMGAPVSEPPAQTAPSAKSNPLSGPISLSANRPKVKPKEPVPEQEVLETATDVVEETVKPQKERKKAAPAADKNESHITIMKFPDAIKIPNEISRKDAQNIEELYYSLKLVRNTMRRTGAEQ